MRLIPVAWPDSAAQTALMQCLLEAHGIPHFVQGHHLASFLPGPSIPGYNTRAIMVPASCAEDAMAAMASVMTAASESTAEAAPYDWRSTLRIVLEFLLFGWFIPGRSQSRGMHDHVRNATQATMEPSSS